MRYKAHQSPVPSRRSSEISRSSSQDQDPFDWVQKEKGNKLRAVLALCLVQTLFSLGTIYTKWALNATKMSPIILVLYRDVFASIILVLLSSRFGVPHKKHFAQFLTAGFAMFLNHALFIIGVDLSGAVVASCIQPSQPVVTFAIAVLVGQEKLNFNRFMGLTLAVVGAIWVVLGDIFWTGKSAAEVGKNSIFGDLCLIANCLSMGLCYVIMKQLNRIYNPMVVIAWVYSYGSASLIFTSLFMYPPAKSSQQWVLPAAVIQPLLYLVLVGSVLCYSVISWSNKHLDSSQVSAFTCLQPVVGSLGAFVFLRERCTTGELIGGVMIVMGLLLTVKESQIKNLTKVVSTKELN